MFVSYCMEYPTIEEETAGCDPWSLLAIPVVEPAGWTGSMVDAGLRSLDRLRGELEAASALLVGARPDDRDATAALSRLSGISNREARRRRAVAAVVAGVAGAADRLREGDVTVEHLASLRPVIDKPGVDALLAAAAGMSPEDFGRAVQQYRLSLEHGDDVTARQHAARSLRFSSGPDGMVRLTGLLPPLPGVTLRTMLEAIRDANYRREHPDRASVAGGHDEDSRDQRLADALLELARITPTRAATPPSSETPVEGGSISLTRDASTDVDEPGGCKTGGNEPDGHPTVPAEQPPVDVTTSKPATVVVVNLERFQAELLNHGPIPITAPLFDHLKRDVYLCYVNEKGEVLKYVRGRRAPSLLQKLAVWARDLRCQYPGCDATAAMSQIHHVNEWLADQGFTDIDLLILLCWAHHKHLHVNQLIAARENDGTVSIRIRATGELIATAAPKQIAA